MNPYIRDSFQLLLVIVVLGFVIGATIVLLTPPHLPPKPQPNFHPADRLLHQHLAASASISEDG